MTLTKFVLAVVAALLIAFDIVVALKSGTNATISHVLYGWSKLYPIIPLGVGIVLGHIFW